MELLLVRHAHALPLAGPGRPGPATDAERPLSAQGREIFSQAVRALLAMGVRVARIEHSPLERAVETAELLAPLCSGPRSPRPALAAPPEARLLDALAALAPGGSAALVGHEPHLSDLLALLCFGDRRPAAGLRFAKGAVARLEGEPEPGGMRLLALWPPKPLAALEASRSAPPGPPGPPESGPGSEPF